MTTLNVCCRLPSASPSNKRFQVSLQSLNENTNVLYEKINEHLSSGSEFDVIHCGQVIRKQKDLSSFSLQNLSTVYVVRKFTNRRTQTDDAIEAVGVPNKSEVTLAIQSALLNLEYRSIVERMLNDPDSVENIIATTPGLDRDPSVLAMLQEPELLAVLAHPTNMDSLLQLHPAFAQAAVTIATAVNEEAAKTGNKAAGAGGLSYSMDQMSDEEEEMPQAGSSRAPTQRSGGQSITASQLAAALQAATGSIPAPTPPPVPQPMPQGQGAGPSGSSSGVVITNDFFQQAMAHAHSASSESALQQLRDMGITDDNVARQALAATGGDIQAALELIFGEDALM